MVSFQFRGSQQDGLEVVAEKLWMIHRRDCKKFSLEEICPLKTVNRMFCGLSGLTRTLSLDGLWDVLLLNVVIFQCRDHHKLNFIDLYSISVESDKPLEIHSLALKSKHGNVFKSSTPWDHLPTTHPDQPDLTPPQVVGPPLEEREESWHKIQANPGWS